MAHLPQNPRYKIMDPWNAVTKKLPATNGAAMNAHAVKSCYPSWKHSAIVLPSLTP